MTVQSEDDFPPNAPSCLRCWPTGVDCLRFYVTVFISIVLLFTAVTYLMAFHGVDESVDCTMSNILSLVLAFWMKPPALQPPEAVVVRDVPSGGTLSTDGDWDDLRSD